MPSKLVGYALLSFLSFIFFTILFNAIAIAQVSAQQPTPAPNPGNVVPTPTIYDAQAIKAIPQKTQNIIVSTPTPTISLKQVSIVKEQSVQNIQPTETPVPPTDTPTPTVLPTATPTPSPEPTVSTSTDLETLFGKYSSQYSVSEDELKKIANCESGFNSASDTGLYAGMYQFSATTWASVRGLMGLDGNPDLRKNAEEAIHTAAFMLSRGEQNAWPNCH